MQAFDHGNIEHFFHSMLNATLAEWVADDQRDWYHHQAAVAFAYRVSTTCIGSLSTNPRDSLHTSSGTGGKYELQLTVG